MELGYKALQSRPELPWVSRKWVALWAIGYPSGAIMAAGFILAVAA